MAAVIGVARKRELGRRHPVRRKQLQQPLGGPDEAARVVPQVDNEPAIRQPTQERDRRVEKRLIVVDVEAPNPQVPEPAVRVVDRTCRQEIGERGRALPLRRPRVSPYVLVGARAHD